MNEEGDRPEAYVAKTDSPFVWAKRKIDGLGHSGYTADWDGAMSKAHSDGMENVCRDFLEEFATGYEHVEGTCESCEACNRILEEMDAMREGNDAS